MVDVVQHAPGGELPLVGAREIDLIYNGDFALGGVGWKTTGLWTVENGYAWMDTSAAVGLRWFWQNFHMRSGVSYVVRFTVTGRTQGSLHVRMGGSSLAQVGADGDYVLTLSPSVPGDVLQFDPVSGPLWDGRLSDISVLMEIPGGHDTVDPEALTALTVVDEYSIEQTGQETESVLDPTVGLNVAIVQGSGASPGGEAQSFISAAPNGTYLHSLDLYLTRVGQPLGNLYAILFDVDGTYGVDEKPGPGNAAVPLAMSEPVSAADVPPNGIFVRQRFYFRYSYPLQNGRAYAVGFALMGPNVVSGTFIYALICEDSQSDAPHSGTLAQANNPFGGWTALRPFNPQSMIFSVQGIASIDECDQPGVGAVLNCPDPSSLPPVSCSVPSPGAVDLDDSFRRTFTSEVGRLLARGSVVKSPRAVDIFVRELIESREAMVNREGYVAAETALLLDRASVETSVRPGTFDMTEEAGLLDRAIVEKIFRGINVTARDFLAAAEDMARNLRIAAWERGLLVDRASVEKINRVVVKSVREYLRTLEAATLARSIEVSETGRLLDRVLVEKTARLRNISARELLAALERVGLAKLASSTSETGRLLDRGSVVKEDRAVTVLARELLRATEDAVITVTPPSIASCQINASLDIDEGNDAIRCRFNTGASVQSVRIERSVNEGTFVFHQNMDVSPNTSGYTSNYYFGSETEFVRFRIRPFSQDGQAGTEGSACTTNLEQIPSGGGGA